MNQSTNQAWQGAAQVARARLQTIDEALARLEAVVPDSDLPPARGNYPNGDEGSGGTPRPEATTQAVPDTSLQALEMFLETAERKWYMPKAV